MATNSLGRLTLDLVVQLGSFQDGFTKAERTVKNTTDNMKQSVKSFGSQIQDTLGNTQIGSLIGDISSKMSSLRGGIALATAGLAGMAVGGAAIVAGTLATMSVELAKTNMQLLQFSALANTSISSFQGLSGAAQLFGMSQEKIADMLKDFNEKIGEFASVGGGEAKDFFEQIAVKTEKGAEGAKKLAAEMSKMDGVTALQTYVDKLEEAGLNQQQMSYYLESMGSDLTALAPILVDGGALWKEYQSAMEEAGIMTSAEAIEQSKVLAAQTGALTLQYEGLKSNLAQAVMPALSGVISYFTDGSVKGEQFAGVIDLVGKTAKVVAVTIVGLSAAISIVGQTIRGIMDLIGNLGKTVVDFWNAPTFAEKGQALWNGFVNNGNILVATVTSQVNTLQDAWKSGTEITNKQVGELDGLAKAKYNITESQTKYNAAQKQGLITGIAQNKALNEQTDAQKKLTEQQKAAAAAAKKLAAERAELNKMVGASALTGLRITGQRAINGGSVRAYTASFAKLVQSQMGKDLGVFTAFNDKYHQGTTSRHAKGQAFDFTLTSSKKSAQTVAELNKMASAYGYIIRVRDEYLNPSPRSTGPHMHVSVLGFNGTKEMQQNAAAEVDLVRKATDEADKIREESLKRQALVVLKYADEETRMQLEHSAEIKQINDAFGVGSEQAKKYISIQEEKFAQEVRLHRLKDAQILNDSQWAFQTEIQRITSKYEFEREQIAATYEYDEMMKKALTGASYKSQDLENDSARHGAWMEYQGAIGVDTVAEEEQTRRNEAIRAALDWQLITQEEYQQKMLESERQYQLAKVQIGLSASEAAFGNMAGALGDMLGEQSTTYKAMFAIQKGFALAQALMAVPDTYSKAYNAVVGTPIIGPYIAPVVGATAAAAQVAQAASIKGMNLTGMAHDGIANIPKEGTWLLNKGERVLNPQDNKAFTQFINSGGIQSAQQPQIIINSPPGMSARTEQRDGKTYVTIEEAQQMVERSWQNLSRPNSKESKAVRQYTTARSAK